MLSLVRQIMPTNKKLFFFLPHHCTFLFIRSLNLFLLLTIFHYKNYNEVLRIYIQCLCYYTVSVYDVQLFAALQVLLYWRLAFRWNKETYFPFAAHTTQYTVPLLLFTPVYFSTVYIFYTGKVFLYVGTKYLVYKLHCQNNAHMVCQKCL